MRLKFNTALICLLLVMALTLFSCGENDDANIGESVEIQEDGAASEGAEYTENASSTVVPVVGCSCVCGCEACTCSAAVTDVVDEPKSFVTPLSFPEGVVFETQAPPEGYKELALTPAVAATRPADAKIYIPESAYVLEPSPKTFENTLIIVDGDPSQVTLSATVKYFPADFDSLGISLETIEKEHFPLFADRVEGIKQSRLNSGFELTYEQHGTAFSFDACVMVFETEKIVAMVLVTDDDLRDENALGYNISAIGFKDDSDSIASMQKVFYSFHTDQMGDGVQIASGEQPAAEGEQPAAEGEQPLTEGEQPAASGEQPAADKKPAADAKES